MPPRSPSLSRRAVLGVCVAPVLGRSLAAAPAASPQADKTVWGIAELSEWILQRQISTGHDTADCLQAHLDHGIRRVIWHLGRSTVDYHSALPTATLYAGDTRPETRLIAESFRKECSLRAALGFAAKNDMVIYSRLTMNRHYGAGYGGGLCSKWAAAHPEWWELSREGRADATRVSFAVPEYRAERIALLLEAARLGAHGLCLDFCRQPPLVRYHPLVVDPWIKQGHPDPRRITAGTPEFLEWAGHRCGFVNMFLRELRTQLRSLEQEAGRRIPILARVTEASFDLNLMEGIDVRTWVRDGLIDELALDPFILWDFDYPQTARPYVDLCHAHAVKIYGGANSTAAKGSKPNQRAFLDRVERNYREGTDGIALYQTDTPLHDARLKAILGPLLPRLGSPAAVTELLDASRPAPAEITEKERWFGVDNHSKLRSLGHEPASLNML